MRNLVDLKGVWRQLYLNIPSEWMVCEHFIIAKPVFMRLQTLDSPLQMDFDPNTIFDVARPFLRNFAALTMNDLHQHVTLISSAAVSARHSDRDSPGPDFLLAPHIPRHLYTDMSMEVVDPLMNTLPHLYRTHDFIRMSASSWEDVNIFTANVFAGFSGYSVQWYVPSSSMLNMVALN